MNTATVLSTIPSTPAATAPAKEAESEETPAVAAETPEAAALEVPVEPTPAPEQEKPDPDLEIAQKLDIVARREARARRIEAQWQTRWSEFEKKEAELAKKLAEAEAALEDPVEYYLKKGKDPVEVVKRFARPVTEEEKRIAKLEERLAREDEERTKAKEEAQRQQEEAQRFQAMRSFVAEITPDEYPHLTTLYPPTEVPRLVSDLMSRPHDPSDPESPSVLQVFRATYNRAPTPKEIRDTLEHEAELRAMSLLEAHSKRSAPSQATPQTPPAIEESTSLSNHHAASSSSSLTRTESREERMRKLKAELEAEQATDE